MKSPCPTGRPRGIVDKRMRLNKALMDSADGLLAVATAKAFEGDPQMLNLLLSRVMPVLRAQNDDRVQFEFDASKPLSDQLAAIAQAAAEGSVSLEQAHQFTEIAKALATVRAMETGVGDKESALVEAFKNFAKQVPV